MDMSSPPTCVGDYDHGDSECDGDETDPRPCTWRDKCGAFKAHLETSGERRTKWVIGEGYLTTVEPFEFEHLCHEWIERFAVVDGLPKTKAAELAKLPIDDLFTVFLAHLVAEVGRDYARPGVLALPGQLYLRDHRKQHGYVTIYCRSRRGHDKPLARVKARRKTGALEIRLPVSARVATGLGLDARVLRSAGQFKSEVVLDEKNALALARKICGLVDDGKIKLPEAST